MPVEPDNIEQRVFDAMPPYPAYTTRTVLQMAFPFLDPESLKYALKRLREAGLVERGRDLGVWRRTRGATMPIDRRGHGKGGRKPKAKAGQ